VRHPCTHDAPLIVNLCSIFASIFVHLASRHRAVSFLSVRKRSNSSASLYDYRRSFDSEGRTESLQRVARVTVKLRGIIPESPERSLTNRASFRLAFIPRLLDVAKINVPRIFLDWSPARRERLSSEKTRDSLSTPADESSFEFLPPRAAEQRAPPPSVFTHQRPDNLTIRIPSVAVKVCPLKILSLPLHVSPLISLRM